MQVKLLAGLMLGLVLFVLGASAVDSNQYQKIVAINLEVDNGVVRELSSEIRYGSAPNLNLQSGAIRGQLLSTDGKIIHEFSIRDPRIQLGDTVGSDTGNGDQALYGYLENTRNVEFGIFVPYSSNLQSINLIDTENGDNLISIDLTDPVTVFRQQYPNDPDMQSLPNEALRSVNPLQDLLLLILGVAMIFTSGAGYLILMAHPKPAKILIVDDEPEIGRLFSLLLARKGYLSATASSGEGCLSILKKERRLPDLILLDVMMYPMDGWKTLEEIKRNPTFKKIPVLMLTGKQPTVEEAKRYGICIEDYILKPIQPQELYGAIEYTLQRGKTIRDEVRAATKAGFNRELVCEYAHLSKQVEVEKKLLRILQSDHSAFSVVDSSRNEVIKSISALGAEVLSRENKLKSIQSQLSGALSRKPAFVHT